MAIPYLERHFLSFILGLMQRGYAIPVPDNTNSNTRSAIIAPIVTITADSKLVVPSDPVSVWKVWQKGETCEP